MDVHERVRDFMKRTVEAMGLPLDVTVAEAPDSVRVELSGDGGEHRPRKAERSTLQQIVNTAFRREPRTMVVRRGLPELPQGQRRRPSRWRALLMEGRPPARRRRWVLSTLRPPHRPPDGGRRSEMSSESIGDAFLKTVIISERW